MNNSLRKLTKEGRNNKNEYSSGRDEGKCGFVRSYSDLNLFLR